MGIDATSTLLIAENGPSIPRLIQAGYAGAGLVFANQNSILLLQTKHSLAECLV